MPHFDLAPHYDSLDVRSKVNRPREWSGFSAEYVELNGAEGIAYARAGDCHYLGIHDLVLDDGEIGIDGLSATHTRDLRNAITFLPGGCSASGWSEPAARTNSFTAISFYSTAIASSEGPFVAWAECRRTSFDDGGFKRSILGGT